MLKIVNPGFNDSLDEYLHKRKDKSRLSKRIYSSIKNRKNKESPFGDGEESRRKCSALNWSIFSFFRKRIPSDEELMQKEHRKKVAQERAEMKDDDENLQPRAQVVPKTQVVEDDDFEDYDEVQHKRHSSPKEKKEGGFMNKLFNFGSNKKDDSEREELAMQTQQQQQNIEDLKETIKVLHRWLEKLPADKISEFKRSPDFEKYKEGLRKLGLIKE